jgi:hypothetical protein
MDSQVGRRVFLGSVAAAMPLLASNALGQSAHNHVDSGKAADATIDHLLRQLGAVHTRVVSGANRGEDARAAAAVLRTLNVYMAQRNLHARIKKGGRDLIARKGRDQVLYSEPDFNAMSRELQRYGVDVTARDFGRFTSADDATRTRALDEMLVNGAAPGLEKLAASFDRTGADIDRSGVLALRRARYWGTCADLAETIAWLEIEATTMCAITVFFPEAGPACAALSLSWAIYSGYYRYNC